MLQLMEVAGPVEVPIGLIILTSAANASAAQH
mgnify:CR=1 FL=1